jgi:hypothetical protein
MKTNLLLYKGLIAALFVAVCVTVSFGQNDRARQDLFRSFRKFDLQQVADQPGMAGGHHSLKLKAAGRDVTIDVEPHDLRAPRYRSEDSAAPGVRVPADTAVTTFKGIVDGEDGSSVRVSIDGSKVEGYFLTRGKKFFVEPAKKYTNLAADGDSVVYQAEDALVESTLLCDADVPTQIESGKQMVSAQAANLVLTYQNIDLATDADQQYVSNFGSAAAANTEILSILNMTEGVYQSELNLSVTVVYQHTWSTPDPFDSTSMSTILDTFLAYWNANITTASVPRDAAHLFTGKSSALSAGLAYVGTMCRFPAYAYGISGYVNWAPGKYMIPTHEIGHTLGANHVDATQSCANTIMNAQLSTSTAFTFCTYSRNEIGTYVSANGSCLTPTTGGTPTPTPTPVSTPTPFPTPTPTPFPTPTPLPVPGGRTNFDFDGDSRADVALFRASTGTWYSSRSSLGFSAFQFGQAGDKPVPADYDGDGITDFAVYRGGVWYRMLSSTNSFDVFSFGFATDIPAPGDFDGDRRADAAVFRPSTGTWYFRYSSTGASGAGQFGLAGDIPVVADYDGDGRVDVNLFRPSNGTWYRLNSSTGEFAAAQFGLNGDKPVAGDFDGDGRADVAVWRPFDGVWYVLNSSNGSFYGVAFGTTGDIPVPADYDGDRRTDVAVFRPSTGVWYRLYSSTGSFSADRFGLAGDIPAAGFYIP